MARGRMVSQSIALDPEFNQLSPEAQLMFLRTIPFLDRDGLILGNPVALWARIAPLLVDLQPRMPSIIQEWTQSGLVMAYVDRGRQVLWFKGFRKNQIGIRYDREAESEFGPPPGYTYGPDDFVPLPPSPNVPIDSGTNPEEVRKDSGTNPEEVPPKLSINQIKHRSGGGTPAASAGPPSDDGDAVLALIKLAYHTVGKYVPPTDTEKGRENLKIAGELIERYGYDRCAEKMSKLKERHVTLVGEGQKGVVAPLPYLQTMLEGEPGAIPTVNGTVNFALEDVI